MKRRAHTGRARSGGFGLNIFTDAEFEDVHLAAHVPGPLPDDVLREIAKIVDAADAAAEGSM